MKNTLLIFIFLLSFSINATETEELYFVINSTQKDCTILLISNQVLQKVQVEFWFSKSAYLPNVIAGTELLSIKYTLPIVYRTISNNSVELIIPANSTSYIGNVYAFTQFSSVVIKCDKYHFNNNENSNGKSVLAPIFNNIKINDSLVRYLKL